MSESDPLAEPTTPKNKGTMKGQMTDMELKKLTKEIFGKFGELKKEFCLNSEEPENSEGELEIKEEKSDKLNKKKEKSKKINKLRKMAILLLEENQNEKMLTNKKKIKENVSFYEKHFYLSIFFSGFFFGVLFSDFLILPKKKK